MSKLTQVAGAVVIVTAMMGVGGCTRSSVPTATGASSQAGDQQSANAPNGSSASGAADSSAGLFGRPMPSTQPITLPPGTVLRVTIDQTLSSADNRTGDEFRASLAEPLIVDGKAAVPRGARVRGRVVEAASSGRLEHPGELQLALRSIEVQGMSYDLRTSSVDRKGEGHKKRNVELIGGGAGAGALIGAIAGHGKGAAIGAVAGAGAGTAGAAATGKQDVSVPAETSLSFRLTKAVTIAVNN